MIDNRSPSLASKQASFKEISLPKHIYLATFPIPLFDLKVYIRYRISPNKRRVLNKRRPLISAAPLGIHFEISASL